MVWGLRCLSKYKVRSSAGNSEEFMMSKGYREGDPSSPVCYNYYHCNAMANVRAEAKEKLQQDFGIDMVILQNKHVGSRRKVRSKAEIENEHTDIFKVFDLLFADDTAIFGRAGRRQEIEGISSRVLGEWGEKVHPDKLERLVLGLQRIGG